MKKGRIFTNCLFIVCTLMAAISFTSCSADSDSSYSGIDESVIENADSQTEAPFSVVLKAYSDNKDITVKGDVDQTTLFVFDQNGDYYTQVSLDKTYLLQAKPVEISCPGSKQITVVAWAGLSSDSENISAMSKANIISDLQVSLKQNNGVAAALPASDVTIELYKDDNMILSSKNVKNLEKVSVNEGEQSEITFDLSKNNCNIVVADWGTVITHVTIG